MTSPQKEDKHKDVRVVKFDDEYDYMEQEEQDEQDYIDEVVQIVEEASLEDEIVAVAIELYRDENFYYDLFRPHISVWVEWYKTCFLQNLLHYPFSQANKDLATIQKTFDRREKQQKMARAKAFIWRNSKR